MQEKLEKKYLCIHVMFSMSLFSFFQVLDTSKSYTQESDHRKRKEIEVQAVHHETYTKE